MSSEQKLRLFIGFPCTVSPQVHKAIEYLRTVENETSSGLRVVAPENLHVTLKFLGSAPISELKNIDAAIDAAFQTQYGFSIQLEGAGFFHGALWIGVKEHPALSEMALRCNTAMVPLGFAQEDKRFRPHVTIARFRSSTSFDWEAWVQQNRSSLWGELSLTAVNLYLSETRPEGARYTLLHTSPLLR